MSGAEKVEKTEKVTQPEKKEATEKKEEKKMARSCCKGFPIKCKLPFCLIIVIAVIIIWFVINRFF